MASALGLSVRHRIQLALHNAMASAGIDKLRRVSIAREGDSYLLSVDGQQIAMPAALLWRSYRRGISARRARLAREFGLGHPFTVAPGEQVIDIGANLGDFAAAAQESGASVLAVDGDPGVVRCLQENLSDRSNILIENEILWCREETVTFYSAPGRADSSIFRPPGESAASFSAEATTLDALASRHGIGDVALIKMDAEGAEPEVLMGATSVLKRTRCVAIDTGPERNGQTTTDDCSQILASLGFVVLPPGAGRRTITLATRPDAQPA